MFVSSLFFKVIIWLSLFNNKKNKNKKRDIIDDFSSSVYDWQYVYYIYT